MSIASMMHRKFGPTKVTARRVSLEIKKDRFAYDPKRTTKTYRNFDTPIVLIKKTGIVQERKTKKNKKRHLRGVCQRGRGHASGPKRITRGDSTSTAVGRKHNIDSARKRHVASPESQLEPTWGQLEPTWSHLKHTASNLKNNEKPLVFKTIFRFQRFQLAFKIDP